MYIIHTSKRHIHVRAQMKSPQWRYPKTKWFYEFKVSTQILNFGWLFWVYQPFETIFQSISGHLPKRGRKRRERIDESKNVQTTPTRTYCKCSKPLPYCNPNCRTPRRWKLTQHHRTTRPPPQILKAIALLEGWNMKQTAAFILFHVTYDKNRKCTIYITESARQ